MPQRSPFFNFNVFFKKVIFVHFYSIFEGSKPKGDQLNSMPACPPEETPDFPYGSDPNPYGAAAVGAGYTFTKISKDKIFTMKIETFFF